MNTCAVFNQAANRCNREIWRQNRDKWPGTSDKEVMQFCSCAERKFYGSAVLQFCSFAVLQFCSWTILKGYSLSPKPLSINKSANQQISQSANLLAPEPPNQQIVQIELWKKCGIVPVNARKMP